MFIIYKSITTGVVTASHKEAVEPYRAGHEIVILVGDNTGYWRQHGMWFIDKAGAAAPVFI